MNRFLKIVGIWLFIVGICFAQKNNDILLVKISDHAKKSSYMIMSGEEYKAYQKEVKLESRFFSKAIKLAQKDWKADEETSKKSFPKVAIAQRKAVISGRPFKSRDLA